MTFMKSTHYSYSDFTNVMSMILKNSFFQYKNEFSQYLDGCVMTHKFKAQHMCYGSFRRKYHTPIFFSKICGWLLDCNSYRKCTCNMKLKKTGF